MYFCLFKYWSWTRRVFVYILKVLNPHLRKKVYTSTRSSAGWLRVWLCYTSNDFSIDFFLILRSAMFEISASSSKLVLSFFFFSSSAMLVTNIVRIYYFAFSPLLPPGDSLYIIPGPNRKLVIAFPHHHLLSFQLLAKSNIEYKTPASFVIIYGLLISFKVFIHIIKTPSKSRVIKHVIKSSKIRKLLEINFNKYLY